MNLAAAVLAGGVRSQILVRGPQLLFAVRAVGEKRVRLQRARAELHLEGLLAQLALHVLADVLPRDPQLAVAVRAGDEITGGLDFNDHRLIWDRLDQARAKHPGMVLLHGGSPKGAERIASGWADNRKVPQIAFKPDWAKHAKAAPFKRNDAMLAALPIGVLVAPGSGIQANLADKARRLGIPVWTLGKGGA